MFAILFPHIASIIQSLSVLLPNGHTSTQLIAAACGTNSDAANQINGALTNIVNALTGIGAGVCALGIAIGGIMRATSFGSERRISESNTAITCAVVGLLVVLLSQGLGKWIGGLVQPECGLIVPHILGSLGIFI